MCLPSLDLSNSFSMMNMFVEPCIYINNHNIVESRTMIDIGITVIIMGKYVNIMGMVITIIEFIQGITMIAMNVYVNIIVITCII